MKNIHDKCFFEIYKFFIERRCTNKMYDKFIENEDNFEKVLNGISEVKEIKKEKKEINKRLKEANENLSKELDAYYENKKEIISRLSKISGEEEKELFSNLAKSDYEEYKEQTSLSSRDFSSAIKKYNENKAPKKLQKGKRRSISKRIEKNINYVFSLNSYENNDYKNKKRTFF